MGLKTFTLKTAQAKVRVTQALGSRRPRVVLLLEGVGFRVQDLGFRF